MRSSKIYAVVIVTFLLILLLSACGGGQVNEPTSVPEPSPTPEIEPEIMDLGNGVRLLQRGLPKDITLDASLDPLFKDNIPPTKNFDYVHTDTVIINITKGGEIATLDKGVVELCFTTTEPSSAAALGDPKPYYWDTNTSPLVDGRGLRVSEKQKEPEYMICTMVQNSGAYAIVAW